MNTPETINIEKYAEALNELIGIDSAYLGDSDKNVNAIIEVIVAAKKLENRVKELETENEKLNKLLEHCEDDGEYWEGKYNNAVNDTVHKMQTMIKEECLKGGIWPAFVARVVENVGEKLLEGKNDV